MNNDTAKKYIPGQQRVERAGDAPDPGGEASPPAGSGEQPPRRSFIEAADLIATGALERHMAQVPPPAPDGDD